MDKKIAGLLGAAAALTTMGGAQAATPQGAEIAPAASYTDLLQPVPNAAAALKADDARLVRTRLAQVTIQLGHHHHHHHHHHARPIVRFVPARHHHHHHHHHHHDRDR
jgi:hypothetical protein